MQGQPGARVVLPRQARVIDIGGFTVLVHADGSHTDAAFGLIETRESGAGLGPPLHIHRDCGESFFVLAGRYRMHIDGRDYECPEGSFVYIPRGVRHTFQSLEGGSRKLNLYTPAGMVGYFEDLADGIAKGMDEAQLDAIAARYDMEIVGPVPEGYL